MKQLCELYAKQIRDHGPNGSRKFKPVRFQEEEFFEMMWCNISFFDQVQHILWMLEEIPIIIDRATTEFMSNKIGTREAMNASCKAHRWLGFVQGWMIKENYCHVNWLRETVREHL
jgi:hypothetical protein